MVRIAIVEDDDACRAQLEAYVRRYGGETGGEFQITSFSDGLDIAEDYRPIYDSILLDIEMPRLDGMTAAERIRSFDPGVILIFITNMAQYAIKGYEVDALDFVLKPVGYFSLFPQAENGRLRPPRPGAEGSAPPTGRGRETGLLR